MPADKLTLVPEVELREDPAADGANAACGEAELGGDVHRLQATHVQGRDLELAWRKRCRGKPKLALAEGHTHHPCAFAYSPTWCVLNRPSLSLMRSMRCSMALLFRPVWRACSVTPIPWP